MARTKQTSYIAGYNPHEGFLYEREDVDERRHKLTTLAHTCHDEEQW